MNGHVYSLFIIFSLRFVFLYMNRQPDLLSKPQPCAKRILKAERIRTPHDAKSLLSLGGIELRDNLAQQRLAVLGDVGGGPALEVLVAGPAVRREARQRLGVGRDADRGGRDLEADDAEDGAEVAGDRGAAAAGVGDDAGGLAGPLVEEGVEGRLEPRGHAAVVLGREEDKGVVGADEGGPAARVRVRVGRRRVVLRPARRVRRLVKDGQRVLLEVERLEAHAARGRHGVQVLLLDVVVDVRAHARRPRAADDERNGLSSGGHRGGKLVGLGLVQVRQL